MLSELSNLLDLRLFSYENSRVETLMVDSWTFGPP